MATWTIWDGQLGRTTRDVPGQDFSCARTPPAYSRVQISYTPPLPQVGSRVKMNISCSNSNQKIHLLKAPRGPKTGRSIRNLVSG